MRRTGYFNDLGSGIIGNVGTDHQKAFLQIHVIRTIPFHTSRKDGNGDHQDKDYLLCRRYHVKDELIVG
jgi:hypothetical protein